MTDDQSPGPATPPGAPPRGRRLPAAAQATLVACAGAALLAALFVLPAIVSFAAPPPTNGGGDPSQSAAFQPTPQQWAGLKVQRVTQADFAPRVQADGRIALDEDTSTPVFSPYSGRVTRVLARAGDVVAAGAPLFAVLSPELAQAQNDMISALATLRTARAQLNLATINENRQRLLFQGHGAALKDYEQSRVDLATAQGNVNSAEIAVAAVRNRLAILGLNRADITAIETASNLEHESADTLVRAPIAGTITQRQINPGQNIVGAVASAGAATAVFTIGDLRRLWMVASAAEPDAPRFHVGDVARVTVPAYPGRFFQARVTFVAPVIDPATHRLAVRAEVENPDLALKPDMLAQFEITTALAAAALLVPEMAVVYDGAQAHVWVADPARHTLALRDIKTGASEDGMVEVLAGLQPGESIVTSGAVFIDRTLSGN